MSWSCDVCGYLTDDPSDVRRHFNECDGRTRVMSDEFNELDFWRNVGINLLTDSQLDASMPGWDKTPRQVLSDIILSQMWKESK